jgi:hypothetical protein
MFILLYIIVNLKKRVFMNHLNRTQRREERKQQIRDALHGEGLYLYENNTRGDLMLPKPAAGGQKRVGVKQQFQGDSYFMQMVRSNDLKLIREIASPERLAMAEQKLLLDQPETVTHAGPVEHVIKDNPMPLNETQPKGTEKAQDVLINENPLDGVVIVG